MFIQLKYLDFKTSFSKTRQERMECPQAIRLNSEPHQQWHNFDLEAPSTMQSEESIADEGSIFDSLKKSTNKRIDYKVL